MYVWKYVCIFTLEIEEPIVFSQKKVLWFPFL